jgi:hypothetical protein
MNRTMTIRYLICDGGLEVPVELAAPADVGQLITYWHPDHVHSYRWIVDAAEHVAFDADAPDAPRAILRCHEKPAPQ